jgi:outer membrane autotransporter protein
MTPLFRKTLLALAITTPFSVQAELLLNGVAGGATNGVGGGLQFRGESFQENAVIKGSLESSESGFSAISLKETDFAGDLILDAIISVSGNVLEMDAELKGRLYNKGQISGANGIYLEWLSARGVENSGTIIASADNGRGIQVTGASDIYGSLLNSGNIKADGAEAVGIDVADDSQVTGGIKNQGEIRVDGTGGVGIRVVENSSVLMVANERTIQVQGDGASGIRLDQAAEITWLENSGNLETLGNNAVALSIVDARFKNFAGYQANYGLHIRNSGTINGEMAAIELGGFWVDGNSAGTLVIENQGDIFGGSKAIDAETASGQVELLWSGATTRTSTITGGLIDLSRIDISGNVIYNGVSGSGDMDIRLRDNGAIHVGKTTAAGHLVLGETHTRVDGNLVVAGNSSLGLGLTSGTEQNKPILSVTGNVEFAANSQVRLTANGSDFNADGARYVLVEAGTLTDNGLRVTSSSSLLHVDTYGAEGSQLVATVTTKEAGEIEDSIAMPGNAKNRGTENAALAAKAFSSVLAGLPANDPLGRILMDGGESEQQAVIRQLAPEITGGATRAVVSGQSMIRNVAAGRTGGARGLSSGGAFAQTGVWVQALNSDATQDLRDGVAGFDASTTGIAVGLDGKLNEQLTLGLAYSFLDTDVDAEGGNKTQVQGHNFTLYSGFVQNGFFVDGSLTYGQNANEGERLIATTLAKADYDSNLLGVNLTAGYTYPLQGTVVVEPQVTARYSNVEIDAIQESGSSAALNTDAQRYEVGELGAGVQLVGRIDLEQGSISPRIKLMAYHDLIADQAQSTSSFVLGGTPFVTTGAKPERNCYEAGLGADYRLGALTLGVSYDYFGKSDYSSDTFSAKVRYDF